MDDVPLPLRPALRTRVPPPNAAAHLISRGTPPAVPDRRLTVPDRLRIVGGTVYDPANGIDGEVRDVCIEDGRIVASLPEGRPRWMRRG